MRTKLGVMILIWFFAMYWFFPKKEEIPFVEQGKQPIDIMKVEIHGAVEFPGVYHIFEPMTVKDVMFYAGKMSEFADLSQINLSEVITKDFYISIPEIGVNTSPVTVKINVNEASFAELITIPGMTESRAASLIIYRESHGDFKHLDELLNVKYIGVATLEKIKPYLTL